MGTKMLLPNQHAPLHLIYGQGDCCLCRTESRIAALEAELNQFRANKAPDCKKPIVDDPVAFAKSVHPYYVEHNWVWYFPSRGNVIPTVDELANAARKLLNELSEGCSQIETGGFSAFVDAEGNYRLKFKPELHEEVERQRKKAEDEIRTKEENLVELVVKSLRETVFETSDGDGCWDVYKGAKAVISTVRKNMQESD